MHELIYSSFIPDKSSAHDNAIPLEGEHDIAHDNVEKFTPLELAVHEIESIMPRGTAKCPKMKIVKGSLCSRAVDGEKEGPGCPMKGKDAGKTKKKTSKKVKKTKVKKKAKKPKKTTKAKKPKKTKKPKKSKSKKLTKPKKGRKGRSLLVRDAKFERNAVPVATPSLSKRVTHEIEMGDIDSFDWAQGDIAESGGFSGCTAVVFFNNAAIVMAHLAPLPASEVDADSDGDIPYFFNEQELKTAIRELRSQARSTGIGGPRSEGYLIIHRDTPKGVEEAILKFFTRESISVMVKRYIDDSNPVGKTLRLTYTANWPPTYSFA